MSDQHWNPSASVITPTIRGREAALARCVNSLWAQTYFAPYFQPAPGHGQHVVEMDDPPHGDWGVSARLCGLRRATGEVIAYLDDDNAWHPSHLERLVPLLRDADFAYSRMLQHGKAGYDAVVGEWPPRLGGLDTSCIVHRRELLELATWEPAGYASDWDLVRRWVEKGARGAFCDAVTVDYYEDAR